MPQAEANVVSQNLLVSTSRKEISWCNKARLRGASTWAPRAWAGASRGLGPEPTGGLGPGPQGLFRRSEKSPGRGLAKGWESAETAAADVGAWREAGTGYPPYPPPPTPPPAFLGCKGERKRVFTLSVTETIQHAPQGRRTKP